MEGENISESLASLKAFLLPVGWVTLQKKLSRCHFGFGIRNSELKTRLLNIVHTKEGNMKMASVLTFVRKMHKISRKSID